MRRLTVRTLSLAAAVVIGFPLIEALFAPAEACCHAGGGRRESSGRGRATQPSRPPPRQRVVPRMNTRTMNPALSAARRGPNRGRRLGSSAGVFVADESNSMGFAPIGTIHDESFFDPRGYHGFPIDQLDVLIAQTPLEAFSGDVVPTSPSARGPYDVVVNGTFYNPDTKSVLGPVIHEGNYFGNTEPKAKKRGAVIVLQNGEIIVARTDGGNEAALRKRFDGIGGHNPDGTPKNPIKHVIGGGAMLIENGTPVRIGDIKNEQKFAVPDLEHGQFKESHHVVIGVKDGQAYVLANHEAKTGEELRADLKNMGFDAAAKFDGGGGFVYNGKTPWEGPSGGNIGRNPTGFAVKTK